MLLVFDLGLYWFLGGIIDFHCFIVLNGVQYVLSRLQLRRQSAKTAPGRSSEPTRGGLPGRGVGDAQFGKKQVLKEVIDTANKCK